MLGLDTSAFLSDLQLPQDDDVEIQWNECQ